MQVDPTLMNVGDGATVSRGISAPIKASATMVGNPPQTLPLEFRGDVTLSHQNKTTQGTDCRAARACPDSSSYNHRPEPSPHPNNAHISGSAPTVSEKRADKRPEVSKVTTDGPGVFPHPQWINVKKGSQDDSVKKPHPQKQPVQSTPSGLQCSAVFQPAPPVTFLPPNSISSSLCKITLPPALGQIAALREATAGQFQKDSPPQSSADAVTPVLRTYPYPTSVGRIPAAEKKVGTTTSKLISNNSSHNKKNPKPAGEHKSPASEVTSPAIALPTQHPSLTSAAPTCYTLSPTAAICRGSALASIPCQNRLLNHVEQSNSADKATTGSLKTKAPSASEELAVCSVEPRDVPLDLSAKSKRPKCVNDSPVTTTQPNNNDSSQRDFLKSKRSHSANYNSAGQYPILPNTHRNGSHQTQVTGSHNHQLTENKPAWGKGSSQDSMKNIPGTYVGVASPILASTLRSKDGNGTFADEFQSFAKQEFISIVDQGEQLASRGKTPSSLMKSSQQAHSVKLVKNSSPVATKTCPSKGALTAALSSSANAQIRHRSGPGKATVLSPAWQHQAFSVKGKTTHGSPKAKGAPVKDGSKFQSSHHSPSKADVEKKWERIKSPLSNLASIVKHQALETSALTGEPVPSGKADPLTGGQDSQSKQMSTFKYSPYWSVKKWAGVPPPGDSTQTLKRYEKVTASEPLEINSKSNTLQASSKPPGQPQLLTSNPSTNGNRMESKLAQVLEGVTPKSEIGASDTLIDQFKGKVGSFPSDQCAGGSEKKTDGTKRKSPTKAKAAVKQKKSSRKSSTSSSKKAKGRKNEENSPIKGSSLKLKKKCSPEQQQLSPSAQKVPPTSKETPGEKISPSQTEIPANNKPGPDSGNPPQSSETPASLSSSTPYRKESDAAESYFPRLRRGRRRTDEARLDLWGFATPSPPPPPVPPPPPASQPSPLTPARRPRGRPRSTSLFEKDVQGKSASAETPTSKKRRRCRSRKYQSEDYITEKVEGGEHLDESDSERKSSGTPADPLMDQCPSPTGSSPDPAPRRPSFTRSGSVRYKESEGSPERSDKPSGKRKFKSKHLSSQGDQKVKTKRSSLGKRGASLPLDDVVPDVKRTPSPPLTPKVLPSSPSTKRGSSGRSSDSESPPKRPVPPEVRRLIVNKNAGETLLQRAARLGYQDVVQYCLEKDIREVNRRDNAGYTALHEASSRGWTQIVQMLLKHGADVNCSAQDGTRPLHDAVASDNLPIVWLLLNHGADPTLATYSGHTPVMLAHSTSMKSFLTEYFTDLDGHKEQDSSLHWEFYSSSLFETNQEPCWDFLLSEQNQDLEENGAKAEPDPDKDCLLFELSSEPLLPCYHIQVSLTQGFCNWFLLTDVLKRLKMSARIFRARYPQLEVVSLMCTELWSQVSVSQVSSALATPHRDKKKKIEEEEEEEEGGLVDLVRCVPELQRLLGSSIHFLQDDEEEEEEEEESGKRTSSLRLF